MKIGNNFQQNFCGRIRLGATPEQAKRMTKEIANTEYEIALLSTIGKTMKTISKPEVKGDFFLTCEKNNTISLYDRQSLSKPIAFYTIKNNDSETIQTAVDTLCKAATMNYGK